VREHRTACGLSLDAVAILAGTHLSTVAEIESGQRRIPGAMISAIARAIEVEPEVLLAKWINAERCALISLPADAHPLAVDAFIDLVARWPSIARGETDDDRAKLIAIRTALYP
jgi:transcriptional regulator with XRE-family HTH domain